MSWTFPESIRAKILNEDDSDWRDLGYFSEPDAMVEEHDNEHDSNHDNEHDNDKESGHDSDHNNRPLEKETTDMSDSMHGDSKQKTADQKNTPSNSDTEDRDRIRRIDMESGIQMELDNHTDYIPYTFVIKEPAQASACCEIHPYIKCPCKNVKKESCATVNCKFKYSKNMFVSEAMLKDGLEIMDIPSTLLETIDKRAMDNERKKRKQQEKRREMLNSASASATSTDSTSENGQHVPQNIVHANIPVFNPHFSPQYNMPFNPNFGITMNAPRININPFNLPFNGQWNQLGQHVNQHANQGVNQPGNLLPIHANAANVTANVMDNVENNAANNAIANAANVMENAANSVHVANNPQATANMNDRMTANFLGTLNMLAANMDHRIPAEKIEAIINRHRMQDTLMMGDPPGDTTDMLVARTDHAADGDISQLESRPDNAAAMYEDDDLDKYHDKDHDSYMEEEPADGDRMDGYMDTSIAENLSKLDNIGEDSPKRKLN